MEDNLSGFSYKINDFWNSCKLSLYPKVTMMFSFPRCSKVAPVIIKVQLHEGLSLGSTWFHGFNFNQPAPKAVCEGCRNPWVGLGLGSKLLRSSGAGRPWLTG